MAVVGLGRNIASLAATRRLDEATARLASSFERLSSGQRINRASDDAAGLSMAAGLNVDRRIYAQARRNLNDGISYLNVADQAVSAMSSVVTRVRELAEESANGTYSSSQRAGLNAEAQALAHEYDRIAATSRFNGNTVLDPTATLTFQAGYGNQELYQLTLGSQIDEHTPLETFQPRVELAASSFYKAALEFTDLNEDGKADTIEVPGVAVKVRLGNGDATFSPSVDYGVVQVLSASKYTAVGDLNSDGHQDLVALSQTGPGIAYSGAYIFLGNGDGTLKAPLSNMMTLNYYTGGVQIIDINADDIDDLVISSTHSPQVQGDIFEVLIGNGNGTFKASVTYGSTLSYSQAQSSPAVADFSGDGVLDVIQSNYINNALLLALGNGDGTFRAALSIAAQNGPGSIAVDDYNGDGMVDFVLTQYDQTRLFLNNGNNTFSVGPIIGRIHNAVVADINNDGYNDVAGVSGGGSNAAPYVGILLSNGNGTFRAPISLATSAGNDPMAVAIADLNGDGVMDLATLDDGNQDGASLSIFVQNSTTAVRFSDIDLTTESGARTALDTLSYLQSSLEEEQARIGASMSRLQSSISRLGTSVEVLGQAEARIADADVSQEAATITRSQILQQTAQAVLAQANLQPQIALQLLRG